MDCNDLPYPGPLKHKGPMSPNPGKGFWGAQDYITVCKEQAKTFRVQAVKWLTVPLYSLTAQGRQNLGCFQLLVFVQFVIS